MLDETQSPRFFDPSGRQILDAPDRPQPEPLGWPAVADLNANLAIDSTRNECLWAGDRICYGDVIDALVRLDALD